MSAPEQYMLLKNELNEKQWRHFLATEALKIGHGGINQVMIASGVDWKRDYGNTKRESVCGWWKDTTKMRRKKKDHLSSTKDCFGN